MVQRATALVDDHTGAHLGSKRSSPNDSGSLRREPARTVEPLLADAVLALRELHLLLRAHRLYSTAHPRVQDSLDTAYESLRRTAADLGGLEIRPERGGIVVTNVSEAHLPDARGEFHALATELQRAGIQTL